MIVRYDVPLSDQDPIKVPPRHSDNVASMSFPNSLMAAEQLAIAPEKDSLGKPELSEVALRSHLSSG